MSFDKARLRQLRPQIEAALQDLAEKEQLSISLGSARFTSDNVTFKLELSTVNNDGTVNTKEGEDFKFYASRYGLKPEALGATFRHAGDVYTIKGCKPRSHKYPILGVNSNGKTYKFHSSTVCAGITDKSLILDSNPLAFKEW